MMEESVYSVTGNQETSIIQSIINTTPEDKELTDNNHQIVQQKIVNGDIDTNSDEDFFKEPSISESGMQNILKLNDLFDICCQLAYLEQEVQEKISECLSDNRMKETSRLDSAYLFTAEKSLLLLAGTVDCTDGILYGLPLLLEVSEGVYNLYIRIFESGVFSGFFRTIGAELIKQSLSNEYKIKEVVCVDIYNNWDIAAVMKEKITAKKCNVKRKENLATVFHRLTQENKTSFNSVYPIAFGLLKAKFKGIVPGYLMFAQRKMGSRLTKEVEKNRYFKVENLGDIDWGSEITMYMCGGNKVIPNSLEYVLQQYDGIETLLLYQQAECVSALPNFHQWMVNKNSGVKRHQYFLRHGKSPRNQYLRKLLCIEHENDNFNVVFELGEKTLILQYVFADIHYLQRPKREMQLKPKLTKKQKSKVNVHDMVDILNLEASDFQSDQLVISTYNEFKSHLNINGVFHWRYHSSNCDIVVTNDVDVNTGKIKSFDYVHTTREIIQDRTIFSCSCAGYRFIRSAERFNIDNDDIARVQCCHCKFLMEIMEKMVVTTNDVHAYSAVIEIIDSEASIVQKVKKGVESLSVPVLKLESKNDTILKYSVSVRKKVEFVHLFTSDGQNTWYVSCQSGLCQHNFGKKRNALYLQTTENLCAHLEQYKEFKSNIEEAAVSNVSDVVDNNIEIDDEEMLVDDEENNVQETSNFDKESGMWLFKSPYGHRVTSDRNHDLVMAGSLSRLHLASSYLSDNFEAPKAMYPIVDTVQCECELDWPKSDDGVNHKYVYEASVYLYSKNCCLPVHAYKLVCQTGSCVLFWTGEREAVFRSSTSISAGYELGWDFVELVESMKGNFASFCSFMNLSYARHCPDKFMSPQSFRKWFFQWASHQLIDFREQCEWCGDKPKVLACDGTKIGIPLKNCHIVPIETPGSEAVVETPHQRNDRCFFNYPKKGSMSSADFTALTKKIRDGRNFLKNYSKGIISDDVSVNIKKQDFLELLPENCCSFFTKVFYERGLSGDQLQAAKSLMYLLSYDTSLRVVLPHTIIPSLCTIIADLENTKKMNEEALRHVFVENYVLGNFIYMFFPDDNVDCDALKLVKHLIQRFEELQDMDVLPATPVPQINSYDRPSTGIAYYFSKDGKKVRDVRTFSADKVTGKSTTETCSKFYPQVAMPGSTFIFLWFCPLHGHCYGFHIVNKSEGRKDPASSLYSYLPEAPDAIFYDFACGLKEYSENRESGYFKSTRMFHDIFHGFSHKCSPLYGSKRLSEFDGVNSSICEQFNSYLQCVKASARHMNQEHFMFYVQFMIHLWNRKKNKAYKKKLGVVAKF